MRYWVFIIIGYNLWFLFGGIKFIVIIFLKYIGDLLDKGMYLLYNNNVYFVIK